MRLLGIIIALSAIIAASYAYMRVKDGYFFDEDTNSFFIPVGMVCSSLKSNRQAYQTWFGNYGKWETAAQLEYDIRRMKQMNVNSLRLDFRWQNIEQFEGIYNFDVYDLVVRSRSVLTSI